MLAGRIILGLGIGVSSRQRSTVQRANIDAGGLDSVIPVFSAELSEDDERGRALAIQFQMNIGGLVFAFGLNLLVTRLLGASSQWAWRTPIILMQLFPLGLVAVISTLPDTPRWYVSKGKEEKAEKALARVIGEDEASSKVKELSEAHKEDQKHPVAYSDMLLPKGKQFHPVRSQCISSPTQLTITTDMHCHLGTDQPSAHRLWLYLGVREPNLRTPRFY